MKDIRQFSGVFEGKNVLVTGHTGFKGAWLSIWLKQLGANVVGYSLTPPTQPSLFQQSALTGHIRSVTGDVRDMDHFSHILSEVQPEIIFHLAAQPLVRQSYDNPIETITTNVLGTAQVLEAIRLKGASVRACQVITSDKCYDNEENGRAYSETDKLGGRDPYSASKACAEILVAAYRNSFFCSSSKGAKISISSVRAGNVIGGGDWQQDRLIPDCIRALSKHEAILIRNPKSTRPWQFILDVLSGYLRLAEQQLSGSEIYGDAWNFGPDQGQSLTVAELTEKVIKEWGSGKWAVKKSEAFRGNEPHEAQLLKLDSSKAGKWLGWKHVYSLDESVRETIRWYRDIVNLNPEETYSYTVKQIEQYTDSARKKQQPWALQEKVLR